jgi:hypothetical protein
VLLSLFSPARRFRFPVIQRKAGSVYLGVSHRRLIQRLVGLRLWLLSGLLVLIHWITLLAGQSQSGLL